MMSTAASDPPTTDVLGSALEYAALGLNVIPIAPGEKYPRSISSWQDAATTDPETIRNWYEGLYRGWGVGILTGARSGVWCLDVDVASGKQGNQSLIELIDAYGPLPWTATAITGSGGRHILFLWDEAHPVTNLQGAGQRLGPGLDVRGTNGQILAAPTLHPTGVPYVWERHPSQGIAPAPGWLYQLYEAGQEVPAPTLAPVYDSRDDGDSAAARVHDYYSFPDLLRAAGWTQLGASERWVRPGKAPRDGHSAILHDDGLGPLVIFSSEAPTELVNAGKPTADGSGVSLSLFGYVAATLHGGDRSACARELRNRLNADRPTVADQFDRLRESFDTPTPTVAPADGDSLEAQAEDEKPANRFLHRLLDEDGLSKIVPPVPLLNGWLFRNSIAFLIGPPKKGKTFVALDLAMAIATGTEWIGGTTTTPGKVLYVLGEGIAGIHDRVIAWRTARDVWGPANITFLPVAVQLKAADQLADLYEVCVGLDVDLVIVDTFARAAVGVDENSSKEMGEVIAGMDRLKDATGACIMTVHHTGKDASKSYRGSSALEGAWDTAWKIDGDLKAMQLLNYQQKNVADGHIVGLTSDEVAGSVAMRRLDQPPALKNGEDSLTNARTIIVSAAGRYRGKKALTYTEWRDRIKGVRASDIKPAFMSLVDDDYFIESMSEDDGTSGGRFKSTVLYWPNPKMFP